MPVYDLKKIVSLENYKYKEIEFKMIKFEYINKNSVW